MTQHYHRRVIGNGRVFITSLLEGILIVCIDALPSVLCDDSVLTVSREYYESSLIYFLEN